MYSLPHRSRINNYFPSGYQAPTDITELVRVISNSTYQGGHGLLSGSFPLSFITQGGNLPSHAEIRVLYRLEQGAGGDGDIVATTTCNADGTWQVSGLDENLKFDIVARIPGFNDVIISDVQPTGAPLSAHFANLKEEYDYRGEVSIQVVALGGRPPYIFEAVSLPDGLSMDSVGNITGSIVSKLDVSFDVTVTDSENTVVTLSADSYVHGDPHWDKVVALLHFDGDLTDETSRTWQKIGDSSFGSGVFGSGLLLTRPNSDSNGLYSNGVVLDSDFTIELFINSNHTADEQCIVSCYKGNGSRGYTWEIILGKTTGILSFYHHSGTRGSYILNSSNKIADGVVHHITVTRQGDMMRLFIDGNLHDSVVESREYTAEAPLCIGYQHGGTARFPYKGMVDEFRITKGVARYTENFTPPTEPFPNY